MLQQYETVEYQGILFAGATNWYGLKTKAEQTFFDMQSNDSKLIKRYSIQEQHALETTMYEKLHKVDVLVTHIPPIFINSHFVNNSTACYLNQLHSIKAKHHVFGHCHEQEIYEQQGAHYYINSLGYPDEKLNQKIRVFIV